MVVRITYSRDDSVLIPKNRACDVYFEHSKVRDTRSCIVLHCVALCCIVLQCVAVFCSPIEVFGSVLQCVGVFLQCSRGAATAGEAV